MGTFKSPKSVKNKPIKASNDILIYADFGCTTGFGNVAKELVDRWSKEADKNTHFWIFALNNFEKEKYNYLPNVTVLPANIMPGASSDVYQRAAFVSLFSSVHFNVIYLINDIEVVGSISGDLVLSNADKKKKKLLQHKTIFYFPIDSIPRPKDLDFLQRFDEIATFTEYGKNVVETIAPIKVQQKIKVITHGVSTKDFYKLPTEEAQSYKIKLFGEDKFVFGTVNRNSARKDISTTILGFKKMMESNIPQEIKNRFVLYCHCNPEDPAGPNLRLLLQRIGLEENKNVFFPKKFNENKGFSVSELNTIYNIMDVFITTSTAEGWGLTLTEAMATETLTISPFHTSFMEIVDGGRNTISLKTHETVFCHDGNKVRYKTTPLEVVKGMHWAASNEVFEDEQKNQIIATALEKVKTYSWDATADEFWKLISKYLK